MIDMDKVQAIIMGVGEGYNDGAELFVYVNPGGLGSTACSYTLTLIDPDTEDELTYTVEARLNEEEE